MLDEEVIEKKFKNENERLLVINALLMLLPTLFLGWNSNISVGLYIAVGILSFLNVANYARTWIDAPSRTVRNFIIALLPYIAVLALTIIGLCNPVVKTVLSGSVEYFALDDGVAGTFVLASINAFRPVTSDLVVISIVAYALSIFFISDSFFVIGKIFFYCVSAVAFWTLLGLVYELMLNIFGMENLPNFGSGSFFTFPEKSHWAVFSMAWLGAGLANSVYSTQRFRLKPFLLSHRFISLVSCAAILLGIHYCGTPLEISASYALCTVGIFMLAMDALPTRKNMERHRTHRTRTLQEMSLRFYIPFLIYLILALSFASSLFCTCAKSLNNPDEMLLVDSSDKSAVTLSQKQSLADDCLYIVRERPIFGWGTASFPVVFAFKQGGDLGDALWNTPHSDLLCKLVEHGFAGLALSLLTPLFLVFRWIFKRDFSACGTMMLLTCLSMVAMSIVSDPFHCMPVYASFWILFCSSFGRNLSVGD